MTTTDILVLLYFIAGSAMAHSTFKTIGEMVAEGKVEDQGHLINLTVMLITVCFWPIACFPVKRKKD